MPTAESNADQPWLYKVVSGEAICPPDIVPLFAGPPAAPAGAAKKISQKTTIVIRKQLRMWIGKAGTLLYLHTLKAFSNTEVTFCTCSRDRDCLCLQLEGLVWLDQAACLHERLSTVQSVRC